ncbi:MAG: DUF3316 domain-containing protein [Muribaculaceae bacterium]|nr:DUF3316 domain-containing protein [Muribaculaceae bacterium]
MNHRKATDIFLLLIAILSPFKMSGEENLVEQRPIVGIYSLEIGRRSVLATYLSPLKYSGSHYAASGYWTKAMPFNPQKAIMEFEASVEWDNLFNPVKTARMIGLDASFSWGLSWRKRLPMNFQITAGGAVEIRGGTYYLLRNSNNPVQVNASGSLDIVASLSKHFNISRLPVLITNRIRIPSLGIFFNPEYGETYYEIYLGNHSGLIHAGWWGNNFRIDNLLSVTLDFGKTAMSIGYRYNLYTQWANHLNTKVQSNSFVIGVVPGSIGLKKRRVSTTEDRIYSIY